MLILSRNDLSIMLITSRNDLSNKGNHQFYRCCQRCKEININLRESYNSNRSKDDSSKTDLVSTILSVFQEIYHTNLNQELLLSDNSRKNLHVCFSNDNCHTFIFDTTFDQDSTKWYDEVSINLIALVDHYELMSTNNEVYNEVETFDLPNEAMLQYDNCQTLFKLKDPLKFFYV